MTKIQNNYDQNAFQNPNVCSKIVIFCSTRLVAPAVEPAKNQNNDYDDGALSETHTDYDYFDES